MSCNPKQVVSAELFFISKSDASAELLVNKTHMIVVKLIRGSANANGTSASSFLCSV